MTDFNEFSSRELEEFQKVYNIHIEKSGSEDDIIWTTKDGRDLALGSMATTHVENTRDYFLSGARRHMSQMAMLEEHLAGNPTDPSKDTFIAEIEKCELLSNNQRFIAFVMMKQLQRRKNLRKPKKRKGEGLTLMDKLDKMRHR